MFRRKRWTPPEPDTQERDQAKRAVKDAVRRLNSAIEQQPEVDELSGELKRIRRENHLVPRISRALGAHSD